MRVLSRSRLAFGVIALTLFAAGLSTISSEQHAQASSFGWFFQMFGENNSNSSSPQTFPNSASRPPVVPTPAPASTPLVEQQEMHAAPPATPQASPDCEANQFCSSDLTFTGCPDTAVVGTVHFCNAHQGICYSCQNEIEAESSSSSASSESSEDNSSSQESSSDDSDITYAVHLHNTLNPPDLVTTFDYDTPLDHFDFLFDAPRGFIPDAKVQTTAVVNDPSQALTKGQFSIVWEAHIVQKNSPEVHRNSGTPDTFCGSAEEQLRRFFDEGPQTDEQYFTDSLTKLQKNTVQDVSAVDSPLGKACSYIAHEKYIGTSWNQTITKAIPSDHEFANTRLYGQNSAEWILDGVEGLPENSYLILIVSVTTLDNESSVVSIDEWNAKARELLEMIVPSVRISDSDQIKIHQSAPIIHRQPENNQPVQDIPAPQTDTPTVEQTPDVNDFSTQDHFATAYGCAQDYIKAGADTDQSFPDLSEISIGYNQDMGTYNMIFSTHRCMVKLETDACGETQCD